MPCQYPAGRAHCAYLYTDTYRLWQHRRMYLFPCMPRPPAPPAAPPPPAQWHSLICAASCPACDSVCVLVLDCMLCILLRGGELGDPNQQLAPKARRWDPGGSCIPFPLLPSPWRTCAFRACPPAHPSSSAPSPLQMGFRITYRNTSSHDRITVEASDPGFISLQASTTAHTHQRSISASMRTNTAPT